MSWNYSGDPAASNKDAVRFEIGDTTYEDQLLTDEEILFALSVEGSIIAAAARCCETLARKYAREADYTLGPQSVKASQRGKAFLEMSTALRKKASILSQGNGLYVGGVDPLEYQKDVDLVQPAFKRGFMDNE
jgi:hypothetical protein